MKTGHLICCAMVCLLAVAAFAAPAPTASRVIDAPLITGSMLAGTDGASINGPSLIRVPDWVENPLGKYYLYFAHHAGKYIRMAYADRLEGPWKIHEGGVLPLEGQKVVDGHIASPQIVIDEDARRLLLFYHGSKPRRGEPQSGSEEAGQVSGMAASVDGVAFRQVGGEVGPAYLQVFRHGGRWFAINHSGVLRTCTEPGDPFVPVATLIGKDIIAAVDPARLGEPGAVPAGERPPSGPLRYSIRHVGVDVAGDRLYIHFSCVGHRPERILCTVVDLKGAPETWRARGTHEVLRPERDWEGARLPLGYSRGGISRTPVNELRDPAVFREGDEAWLLYSVAGEHGIGLARLEYGSITGP